MQAQDVPRMDHLSQVRIAAAAVGERGGDPARWVLLSLGTTRHRCRDHAERSRERQHPSHSRTFTRMTIARRPQPVSCRRSSASRSATSRVERSDGTRSSGRDGLGDGPPPRWRVRPCRRSWGLPSGITWSVETRPVTCRCGAAGTERPNALARPPAWVSSNALTCANVAPPTGLEPVTLRLTVGCSAN